jgi:hypothetical protein
LGLRTWRQSKRPLTIGQGGQAAIILLLLILGVGVTVLVYNFPTPAKQSIERDKVTAAALAQAKAALIGFAAGIDLGTGASRPGDLPCPDMDNDGTADTSCSGGALGRLPWSRLGLQDLRDGDGERLWYAVSSNFKNNPRTTCTAPSQTTCLNSDTRGTITVRNKEGTVIYNGNDAWSSHSPSGVIAVVIAPGGVLQRQGAASAQTRGCTVGVDCDANELCTTSPPTLTAKCNPVNYLDNQTGVEDNAAFTDGSGTDGFINGIVLDADGNQVVNDQLIVITWQDLMPPLERRVAKEAYNCMASYAAASNGRYPWAASVSASASGDYSSAQGERFGRIPDSFAETLVGLLAWPNAIVNLICGLTPSLCMSNSWPAPSASPACYIATGSWWLNWKEHVFYGVADAYKPAATVSLLPLPGSVSVPASSGCVWWLANDCLTVDPPSASDNKRFVVLVAGKRLAAVAGGQPRDTTARKGDTTNYLEGDNDNSGTSNTYEELSTSTTFNDILLYQ